MLDLSLIFDGTAPNTPVAITNTRVSTNVIDWLSARDVGADTPLALHVAILTAFTTTNSATLQVQYEVCSTAGGTFLPLILSPVVAATELIVGCPIFRYDLPVNQEKNATLGILNAPGRFGRLTYTVGTGVFSAGAVFSYITPRQDRNQYYSYPNNYTAYVAVGEL